MGVTVDVFVTVWVGVVVGVFVADSVGVIVGVCVEVTVRVTVGVFVDVGVGVSERVLISPVSVGVAVSAPSSWSFVSIMGVGVGVYLCFFAQAVGGAAINKMSVEIIMKGFINR